MSTDADQTPMILPAVLDLTAAEKLLGALQTRLQATSELRIDAAAVDVLTLPCAQIILAALRSHDQVSIERPSEAFTSAFADLGLDYMPERSRGIEAVAAAQNVETVEVAENVATVDQIEKTTEHEQNGSASQDDNQNLGNNQPDESVMAKRILTIDDSKTIRDMLMLTLSAAGYDVLQAVDGQDGLDVLGQERVDVIITDINMPKMDGYEVIRHLRRNPVHKTTPILVLTTESDTEKKNLAREAGATGWMVKPFDPDRLLATVSKVAP